ncbi:hypothetical protein C8R46DRAFT_1108967 [Mycena filopes]|nr:hypothetical protein C8R46DRAFT_1108967 [Mycena filopes]
MLHVFYVLFLICTMSSVSHGLKVHRPGKGMVVANQPVDVSWTRQKDDDPTEVLMLMENLIGGDLTPAVASTASGSGEKHTTTSMAFTEVGTFRMWAVNPSDPSESYAKSDIFVVNPNNVEVQTVPTATTIATPGAEGGGAPPPPPPPPPPSATPTPAFSPAPASSPLSSAATTKPLPLPLILAATLGSLVLLALLLLFALYMVRRRRQARTARHTTFHQHRMVRALSAPVFAPGDEVDFEKGEEGYGGGKGKEAYPFAASV